MPLPRSTLLLVLLTVIPLALLVWLGTYLWRDGERRAEATRTAILLERLQLVDYHLNLDLQQVVQQLDFMVESLPDEKFAAGHDSKLATHPHIERILWLNADGKLLSAPNGGEVDADLQEALGEISKRYSAPAVGLTFGSNPFRASKEAPVAGWQIYQHTAMASHLLPSEIRQTPSRSSGLILRGEETRSPDGVYWYLLRDGRIFAAVLRMSAIVDGLLQHVAEHGVKTLEGLMVVAGGGSKALHSWGQTRVLGGQDPDLSMTCSPPFQQWKLTYYAGPNEFPSAMLFPILLGVTSGSLLVPSLAWMFFRESSRELRLAQQRVSFVNQVSHELKTPLTNIRLYAEMARGRAEQREDEPSIRQLSVVESETARLSRLIHNVLSYSRKQRDRLSVQLRNMNVVEVVERVIDHWKPLLDRGGIKLERDLPSQLHAQADADALEQILGNLLSNVEKYALSGSYVKVSARQTPGGIELAVEDRGPGIPQGKQELVFEPFERLRSDLQEGVSGTGIGLTISREMAQLHGGTLKVDPTLRGGARFVLHLPIQSPNETPQSKTTL